MGQSLIRGCGFRHGIITACIERVAAKQAANSKPAASRDAIAFDGGVGITGAGRIETATRPQHGRDDELIPADDPHE